MDSSVVHVPNSPLSYVSKIGCANSTEVMLPYNHNKPSRRSDLSTLKVSGTLPNFEYFNMDIGRNAVHVPNNP